MDQTKTGTQNQYINLKILPFAKIIRGILLLVVLVYFQACNQNHGNEAVSDPKATQEVAAAVEALNNALVDPKESQLKSITLPQLTYGHSSGVIQNREEFIDQLMHGEFDFLSVSTSD